MLSMPNRWAQLINSLSQAIVGIDSMPPYQLHEPSIDKSCVDALQILPIAELNGTPWSATF